MDSIARFAQDMRALRHDRNDPTLTALQARTGVSKSTFSSAFRGVNLPSEKTVRAIMAALGEAPTPWLERRSRLASVTVSDRVDGSESTDLEDSVLDVAVTLDPAGDPVGDQIEDSEEREDVQTSRSTAPGRPEANVDALSTTPRGDEPERPSAKKLPSTISRRSSALLVACATVFTVVVTSAIWGLLILPESDSAASASDSEKDYVPYADGVDPMQTVCREDVVVGGVQKYLNDQIMVEMLYSNKCMAGWARVTRYDGQASGNSLKLVVYPEAQMEGARTQERSALNLQSLYSTMLIEPDVSARICGVATVSQDEGDPQKLEPALCI